jgi:2,3-bisphosphoglycerate-independent phosphoglycerate mutase
MKYIVIIGDGMSDWPIEALGGLTPLQKASTPNMDSLAGEGIVGKVKTIPEGLPAGSDVANLSILGYDPAEYYSGRAPLEAASMGVELDNNDIAYRCNVVTLEEKGNWNDYIMADYSAGHITSEESHELIKFIDDKLGSESIRFYPGISYRHLMVWKDGKDDIECTPPHDIIGKKIAGYLPEGSGSDVLTRLMRDSVQLLSEHGVNRKRASDGKNPANSIWFWGQGRKPSIPGYKEKYDLSGALISAVDLTKGLGVYAGFDILNVPGATGYLDTNYTGKAEYALKALETCDFVYLHIEAPDEAGHNGNVEDKIKAIEDIDSLIVGPVLKGAQERLGEFRILLMPDHATPISVRTHTEDFVPFAIYDSRESHSSETEGYNEDIIKHENVLTVSEGHKLMDFFIKGTNEIK